MTMTTADGWDLTVPESDEELLAELRRRGVRAGQHLHVVATAPEPDVGPGRSTWGSRFRFAGIVEDGPTDVASTVDEHLAEGFGRS